MDDSKMFGAVLNQLGQTVKQTAKQITKVPGEMAEDAKNQVIGGGSAGSVKSPSEQSGGQEQVQRRDGWKSDEERVKFLRGLYGVPESSPNASKSTTALAEKPVEKTESQDKKNTTSANPFTA
jgi:hypothetical protein